MYRSAYKNARSLAATESNIAYRTADYERWQQLDFVVGIRVVLSNNHTLNGEPFYDICDRLSAPMGSKATKGRGCYPKIFKFTGWHPLCRCHTETILKTLDEMRADEARILSGEPVSTQSENSVDDVPQEFKDWIKENEERIERTKSLPYFIRDNAEIINKISSLKLEINNNVSSTRLTDDPILSAKIEANRREYERLVADPNYTDVEFNPKNGALKAMHKGHNFDKMKGKYNIPRGDYEKITVDAMYKNGYKIVLVDESDETEGVKKPDGYLDDSLMDIKGIEGNPLYALGRANKQGVETTILYYHNATSFDMKDLTDKYINLGKWLERTFGKPIPVNIKRVICVVNKDNDNFDIIEIKKP